MDVVEKLLLSAASSQWKEIGVRHHHGICIPLFSLHSEQSSGIGEFLDLLPLLAWCKEIGLDVIQLLPLNDTGLENSPYNALSAFALNPVHLSLASLPNVERVSHYREKLGQLRTWNSTERVKYTIVRDLKRAFLREYFSIVFPEMSNSEEYLHFLRENRWSEAYALFKAIKESQNWTSWEDWPAHLRSPSESSYRELLVEFANSVHYHQWVQYLCYSQFERVKHEATAKGIYIKGDIPILISRDSADVWHQRQYFLLHLAAGAPPDLYSQEGQYWGFPLYDWEAQEKDDYQWWRERLRVASHLYHLYRIDHIVGFFRIWSIPLGRKASEGSFYPPDQHLWIPHGQKIMEMMLQSAPILPIGEDLGVVPPEVRVCLRELGICGTKMMRWERHWDSGGGFISLQEYPPESMTTVSTHDSDTLQLWWRHFPKEAKLFSDFKGWGYRPFLTNERLKEILTASHHSTSLFHINLLQEYLSLFPELISPNPNNERINIPGKVLDTNWTYRFRPSVEQLIAHIPLKEAFKQILLLKS